MTHPATDTGSIRSRLLLHATTGDGDNAHLVYVSRNAEALFFFPMATARCAWLWVAAARELWGDVWEDAAAAPIGSFAAPAKMEDISVDLGEDGEILLKDTFDSILHGIETRSGMLSETDRKILWDIFPEPLVHGALLRAIASSS